MRLDLKRLVHGTIDFSSYAREHVLALPETDAADVRDARLSFYAGPAVDPLVPSQGLTGVEDLRLYANGQDLTEALRQELRFQLSQGDRSGLEQEYRRGGEAWLRLYRRLGDDPDRLEEEERALQAYVAAIDSVIAVDRLGDRSFGWSGNLHVVNFLYRFVRLEPLSLQAVYDRHRIAQGLPAEPIKTLWPLVLILSQGPAPSLEDFSPSDQFALGRVVFTLELIYANPLAELLQAVSRKVEAASRRLERQRVQYLSPIKDEVDQTAVDLDSRLDELKTELHRIEETVRRL